MADLNTGLSAPEVLEAFDRALHDYTNSQIDTMLAAKQTTLTFDSIPTDGSTNPVRSDGIYDFVNSSVATNTANFIGTFNSVAELEAYSGTVTNNDYAFVISTDSAGNTVYNRYKYNGSAWAFEYALNNSSFTAAQWATIQSGLTASDKTKLDGIEAGANKTVVDANLSQTSTNPVQNKTVNAALAAKQDTIADLTDIRSGAAEGATAVQPAEFEEDQARQEVEIGAVANSGAKNVLKNTAPYGELVRTNITFIHNSDDTYLVNAENPNTAATDLYISANISLAPGNYILTGCPAGGDYHSTYKLQIAGIGYDIGDGFRFTIAQTTTISVYIRIWAGYVPNGLVFTPMIRRAEITDDTFVPYAPTNRELYETKANTSELHALLPNITSSTTIQEYVNALSKGVYTAFIANASNPSDSPINANCFVNIYVYSATTAAVELIPLSSAEMSRTYTMRKISGTWREWYMHEGAVVS